MKKSTRTMLLLMLALSVGIGWSTPASAAPGYDSVFDIVPGLEATLEGCYELTDSELVEVEELAVDKVYFISATLKNVAELPIHYWTPEPTPEPDPKYNDELYGIWFQLKLPTTISHDAPGQVLLEASASRRNYYDRWNTSDDVLEVYVQDGQALALEFAPGYCDEFSRQQVNSYSYYLRSEDDVTFVRGIHDSENPLASGAERKIMIAVRTHDSEEFAAKRELEQMSHLRISLASPRAAQDPAIKATPILSDFVDLSQILELQRVQSVVGIEKCLTVRVEIPEWLEQQPEDEWYLQTRGKVYAEDGNVCFWAGLYNHDVIYDLDGTATQGIFTEQTALVHLDSIEAWYFDAEEQKVTLELVKVMSLPDLSEESSPSIILENNGISAKIALNGDLINELTGKTIYLSYNYSQIDLVQ